MYFKLTHTFKGVEMRKKQLHIESHKCKQNVFFKTQILNRWKKKLLDKNDTIK